MGVIVNKEDDKNTELSRRINADLRAKMSETVNDTGHGDPDFSEDVEYTRDLKKTGRFSWVWVVLVLAILAVLIIVGVSLKKQ